jgi:hypothetical protein
MACAIAVGLAIGTALPTSAIGLTQVTLNCDDGTSVTLVVDTDTLTSLTASVQAMLDYPAGLTCTLVQSPLPLILGAVALASPGSSPFVVAGGRWQVPCDALALPTQPGFVGGGVVARIPGAFYSPMQIAQEFIWVNIAVNVHQKDSGDFFGTLNETIPANQTCPADTASGTMTFGESHFTSKPTCLTTATVSQRPQAFVTSLVTQTSGEPFPADMSGSVSSGDYVHFGFWDNQNPPGQNPTDSTPSTDMLAGPPATPEGSQGSGSPPVPPPCSAAEFEPIYHLGDLLGTKQYGNISIRNSG